MYVGVDLGTSVTKAAAFDRTGRMVAVHGSGTVLSSPRDGWFEQDIDEVVASLGDVVRRVVAEVGEEPELIGLTGQGDGLWLTDAEGRAVRPAISWMDGRSSGIVRRWIDDGIVEELFRRNGGVVFPGCPAPVLAWLAAHEPESLARAETAGYCKDAMMQRLTGVRATDVSDASLPFLDPRSRTYDPGLLELCGLTEHADLLAPIAQPRPTGRLTAEAAELLGLSPGIPVSAGPFDLAACARGSGVSRIGSGHVIVGTTLACQVLVDEVDTSGEPSGLTISIPGSPTSEHQPTRWLRAMPTMVGTAALDWLLALVGETHARVDDLLAQSSPGANGVLCLPYFSASGERAPFVDTAARARFSGLTVGTTKADLVRATCEAIAFAGRHCLESAGLSGDVAVCGGGVRSAGWLQIFADVLGRQVHVAVTSEVGAYGAVLAAFEALGPDVSPDVDPNGWTRSGRVVQPDGAVADHYAVRYDDYLRAVARAREEWKELL
ncbi:MAG TPA: FGGY-family carbohydrate kinase [Actinopolymorphaceae bacterium]